jgi:hypothetical protein
VILRVVIAGLDEHAGVTCGFQWFHRCKPARRPTTLALKLRIITRRSFYDIDLPAVAGVAAIVSIQHRQGISFLRIFSAFSPHFLTKGPAR